MILTEKELELVCCAIMSYKVDGKHTMRNSQIAEELLNEFVVFNPIVIEIVKDPK